MKKYLPFIFLLAAAALLWYVKTNQRGHFPQLNHTNQDTDHLVISPSIGPDNTFNRNPTHIIYSKHARCRMGCRHIDEGEVKEILEKGEINYKKIESDERGETYPLEGITHDNQHVRIVFAPKGDAVEVVTCIDLDTEWPCDCR